MRIAIINGPNLSHIGQREPQVYGDKSFDTFLQSIKVKYPNIHIDYYQSNHEGNLIDYLYTCTTNRVTGIVLNAGAYTHTSIALLDAIRAIDLPVIEVHISNIYARESFRQHSILASACWGVITGLGLESYRLAIEALIHREQ